MDNSPEYIKMSEAAEEIQEQRPTVRDNKILACTDCGTTNHNCISTGEVDDRDHKKVWLPMQDQLQEILIKDSGAKFLEDNKYKAEDKDIIGWVLLDFHFYCQENDSDSIEKLWLMYFMKQKHNKTWNGEEWTN